MYYPIRIKGKMIMKNGLTRCYCNGFRLTGTEEEVKNSCKMIKLTGLNAPAYLNYATKNPVIANKAIKLDLPEWEEADKIVTNL